MDTIDKPVEVPVEEARKKLGDHVLAAKIGGRTTTLTYHGKPYALIVPIPSEGKANRIEGAPTS